jgi:hypothetical protein
MRNRKKEKGICPFCLKNKELTDDHIPPKNLFPKPRPNTLITVKSCKFCNSNTSKDDEYFRLMLTMMHGLGTNPLVFNIQDIVVRSLARKEAQGLAVEFLKTIQSASVFTAHGLYMPHKPIYCIDDRRLNSTARKIVKGLFYYEFKKPVPADYDAYAYFDFTIQDRGNFSSLEMIEKIKKLTYQEKVVVKDGFSYSFHKPFPEETDDSYWILKFYNRAIFTGFVLKNI